MSDPANAPTGATPEQGLGAWPGSATQPDWEQASPGAGSAEPAPAPGAPAAHPRRPLSLRGGGSGDGAGASDDRGEVPRRRLTPPPFPRPRRHTGDDAHAVAGDSGAAKPAAKLARPAQIEKFVALTRERPEVGVAVAFAGGVLIATVLKRFAHR